MQGCEAAWGQTTTLGCAQDRCWCSGGKRRRAARVVVAFFRYTDATGSEAPG